jgi:UDPglucose 6-dehydrogenase
VRAYDPKAMDEAREHYIFDKVTYCTDAYDACVDADALLLVTEWSEFRIPSWDAVGKLLKNKVVFDGRNIYDKKYLESIGFTHYGIGLNKDVRGSWFDVLSTPNLELRTKNKTL